MADNANRPEEITLRIKLVVFNIQNYKKTMGIK